MVQQLRWSDNDHTINYTKNTKLLAYNDLLFQNVKRLVFHYLNPFNETKKLFLQFTVKIRYFSNIDSIIEKYFLSLLFKLFCDCFVKFSF